MRACVRVCVFIEFCARAYKNSSAYRALVAKFSTLKHNVKSHFFVIYDRFYRLVFRPITRVGIVIATYSSVREQYAAVTVKSC